MAARRIADELTKQIEQFPRTHLGTEPRNIRRILQRAATQGRPYRWNQFYTASEERRR
jgi:hypothetical protein